MVLGSIGTPNIVSVHFISPRRKPALGILVALAQSTPQLVSSCLLIAQRRTVQDTLAMDS